ncbi:protein FAM98A-like isoform X2 [Heterodontus francisci]|uniref:protein FAM98A-like isoform X2 n=1 Tax=Heterodontus francisci TaxID=7792 RepID=UPI00355C980C
MPDRKRHKYTGQLIEEDALSQAAEEGPHCSDYTTLCSWLVSELKAVSPLEECVTTTTSPEDAETFQLEVSGLVSELQCPYPSLTTGNVTARLNNKESCLQLLLFLGSELQAARVLHARKPSAQRQVPRGTGDDDDEIFKELQALCQALGMAELTRDVSVPQLFRDLETKIREASSGLLRGGVGKPLLSRSLEPDQWEHLKGIHQAMCLEYDCRRQMLISRLDVTVQSFHWSEGAQKHGAVIGQLYEPLRQALCARTSIALAHLLAAREDLSVITKTTCESSREKTACAVNKVLMGAVPDRGGRPSEIDAPMPMWEDRHSGGGGRRQKWRGKGRKHK